MQIIDLTALRFVLPNFNKLSLGLDKPDCVGVRLGLEIVFRFIKFFKFIIDVMKS